MSAVALSPEGRYRKIPCAAYQLERMYLRKALCTLEHRTAHKVCKLSLSVGAPAPGSRGAQSQPRLQLSSEQARLSCTHAER